jgi:regulator of replication initiation timing
METLEQENRRLRAENAKLRSQLESCRQQLSQQSLEMGKLVDQVRAYEARLPTGPSGHLTH